MARRRRVRRIDRVLVHVFWRRAERWKGCGDPSQNVGCRCTDQPAGPNVDCDVP
jgi:hypothetical protein